MWCRICELETTESICPECGTPTEEEILTEIRWCKNCRVPIIKKLDDADKEWCPICGTKTKYLSTDLRPVFPEERLLLELLLGKKPNEFLDCSVWAVNSTYYINGKRMPVGSEVFRNADAGALREMLEKNKENNTYFKFNDTIKKFVDANKSRLDYLEGDAARFIKRAASRFEPEQMINSFSGGKDSSATANVVLESLGIPEITHLYGDTTLEFPSTHEYVKRYRAEHGNAEFRTAINREQVFYDVCEDIGPPARMMRWCCSMFKTGPITRMLNRKFGDQQILTFYGIRKVESVSRSKYNQIEENSSSVKIQKQTVASPIFFWKDFDIWLYLLAKEVDFNDAYRLGYDRVGCWCCPNNNDRAQFLSRIYMPEAYEKWREFLVSFAKKIGKPDPEEYIDSGKWKARQGGNGVPAASDVKIRFTNCTAEDHAKIYKLSRPFDDSLIGMLTPFGKIAPELGRKLINETIVLDIRTNVPIISVQPFSQDGYEYAVKIKTMNVADHDDLQRMIAYQVRKFNACRKCLKCESVCRHGAISIVGDDYYINPDKCKRCKMCVNQKYLTGGCMMDKYLRTKD